MKTNPNDFLLRVWAPVEYTEVAEAGPEDLKTGRITLIVSGNDQRRIFIPPEIPYAFAACHESKLAFKKAMVTVSSAGSSYPSPHGFRSLTVWWVAS